MSNPMSLLTRCASAACSAANSSASLLGARPVRAPRQRAAQSSAPIRCSRNSSSGGSSENGDGDPTAGRPSPEEATGFRGFGEPPRRQMSSAEALRESLGGVSSARGRVAQTTNIVLGTDGSEEKWRELDAQVNAYPGQRTFKVIGAGGDDFAAAMTACVASVVGTVHRECVSSRPSSQGKYLSVTIDVYVENVDQVVAIYELMRKDERLRYFI